MKKNSLCVFALRLRTFGKEYVYGDAASRQQQRARLTLPASNHVEEAIDHQLGWNLDGGVDEVHEVNVESKSTDVQADPIVRGGNAEPAEQRISH